MKKKVMVAMSGGVDSSVAAVMMIEQGYDVAGITMVMDGLMSDYSTSAAVQDSCKVAAHLGITHFVENTSVLFKQKVLDDFVATYASGATPNPCAQCNQFVKFGRLLERAQELGYEYLVTGHYATLNNGVLQRGMDPRKDQSYFLYPIYSVDISRIIFPLGSFAKTEIREIAAKNSLPVAHKAESQDICFITNDNYSSFLLENGLHSNPGDIVDIQGKKIGVHQGIWNYTIGQRKGLGALGQRMFVKEIVPHKNIVIAATDDELCRTDVCVNSIISCEKGINVGDLYNVQIRYRSAPTMALVVEQKEKWVRVEFKEPVRAVAPGQRAVFYDGDKVIGGGVLS